MRIGNLEVTYRTALAPMAGLTDIAFRRLLDEIGGVGLMVSEMISAEGLRRRNFKTGLMIRSFEFKTPQFIQLFGSESLPLAEAARLVESETDFSGIDINMGCPAGKVTRRGAGAALLAAPQKVREIVRAVRRSTRLPLTVKIRLGYSRVNVSEIVEVLNGEGVDALTVHFRLKSHRYGDEADWSHAPHIKKKLKTILIGNGDIMSAEDGRHRLNLVDGIMIGRGAIANPFIFREIGGFMPAAGERAALMKRLVELISHYYEPPFRLSRIKAFTRFMAAGRAGSKKTRQEIYTAESFNRAAEHFIDLFK